MIPVFDPLQLRSVVWRLGFALMSRNFEGMMAGLAELRSSSDTKSHYDKWASTYDRDMNETYGYIGPTVISNALSRDQIARTSSILDAGCGTGLIGDELKKRGFLTIYGADISDGMRVEAEKKTIYRRVIAADFSKPTHILDGVYDIIVAADTFGPGQFTPQSLTELIRLVRRSGPIYALIEGQYFESAQFAATINNLEQSGSWTVDRVISANIMRNATRAAKLVVARRR